MATLLIRKLDDDLKTRLRQRAAEHGRSMEEEARTILQDNLRETPINRGQEIIDAFRETFGPLGGVELDLPSRKSNWAPPTFE